MTASSITVRTSFQGIHFWEKAPPQVAFLRNPHRHVFHVSATCPVTHGDRELEFFMVKQDIDTFIHDKFEPYHKDMPSLRYLGQLSCEVLANQLSAYLCVLHARRFTVSVQEDDENSATDCAQLR